MSDRDFSALGREALERQLRESIDADDPQDSEQLAQLRTFVPLVGPDLGETIRDQTRQRELAMDVAVERMIRAARYFTFFPKLLPCLVWQLPARVTDQVYRAHVEELLDREMALQRLQPGTRAEVLTLVGSSVACGPVDADIANVFLVLCWEVLGDSFCAAHGLPRKPSWTPETWQLFQELSRRLFIARRRSDTTRLG
jgi:hypothetical protein